MPNVIYALSMNFVHTFSVTQMWKLLQLFWAEEKYNKDVEPHTAKHSTLPS